MGIHDSNKVIFFTVLVLVLSFIIDISLLKTYDLVPKGSSGILYFSIIAFIYCIGQYLSLKFVRFGTTELMRKNRSLFLIERATVIVQYILVASLVAIILQMFLTTEYSTLILSVSITISYGLASFNLAFIAKRFFSWFRINNHYLLVIYGLSSATLSISAILIAVFVNLILLNRPQIIMPTSVGSSIFIPPYSAAALFDSANTIFSIISFVLTWIGTFVLLNPYSTKIGRLKFLFYLSLPLLFYLTQFPIQYSDFFSTFLTSDTIQFGIIFTVIFSLSKLSGGIMFGVAFWIIVRKLDPGISVRTFMIISALGFILLFISNQATAIVVSPYPPYGLPTFLFLGFSSYLVLVGIYGSAISVAEDSKLRKVIKNYIIMKSKLLDSMGTAAMEESISNKANQIFEDYKDELQETSGLKSSLTDNEITDYMQEVLKEVKIEKQKDNDRRIDKDRKYP
jgi:hypothetical protein